MRRRDAVMCGYFAIREVLCATALLLDGAASALGVEVRQPIGEPIARNARHGVLLAGGHPRRCYTGTRSQSDNGEGPAPLHNVPIA